MLRWPRQGSWIATVLAILLIGGAVAAWAMLKRVHAAPWHDWRELLHSASLLLVAGVYLGTIAVLDGKGIVRQADRPFLRTLLCGALAALLVLLVQARPPHSVNGEALVLGFLIGAVLGYIGWSWAQHVDL